jgi:argininosuccinate lyase
MPLWDGRFSGGPAADMVRFSECLDVDMRMWQEDIQGSIAHAEMLGHVGLVTEEQASTLVEGLHRVAEELDNGSYVPRPEHEDIHMAVEARLIELVGQVGERLHTARSRNDQVATDVRLWMRRRLQLLAQGLDQLVAALLRRVEADGRVLMPGFTHLQQGQPILLGHHLLAHAWMIRRDSERIADCLKRLDACPLGAGAMAGTPLTIDRHFTAKKLGFSKPTANAMDSVAARDHLCEAVSACAMVMIHLSRQAEELVLWSTREFGFVRLGDGYTTGSSMMPQKRNPDAAELVRGKAGRVVGALNALLTMEKGLPLAYNRDLQEDRNALFDAIETTLASVQITSGMWETLTVNGNRYESSFAGDFILATEIADHLVTKGVPFREAHHVVGRLVLHCEEAKCNFNQLSPKELAVFHPELAPGLAWLNPRSAAERRRSHGGTAWEEVQRQVELLLT